MDEGPVKITIVLPPEVARDLDAYAAGERRSRSNAATVLLEEGLSRKLGTTRGLHQSGE